MRSFSRAVVAALFIMSGSLLTTAASASDTDERWYFTPMASFIDDASGRAVDDELNGGQFGFGRAINENWGFEVNFFGANYNDRYGNNEQKLRGFGVDWLRHVNRDAFLSPYVLGGISYASTDRNIGRDSEDLVGNLGLGLMTNVSDNGLAIRTEARMRSFLGNPHLNDMVYSVGMSIPLGKKTPPPPPDSDGDGVIDANDRCANTPAGTPVDVNGCELDNDGDGVANSKDKCPNTARGKRVDGNGCEIVVKDSDGDGVADNRDACPNTPRGAQVDARGCELDGDKDGVVNSKDRCPNSPRGAKVDINGCEIKDKINLPGVRFELNSAKLRVESFGILNEAVATLKKHPDINVLVAGHTDSSGADSYNMQLSEQRAKTVARYLAENGIAAARIQSKGFGETEPTADNNTKEGRAANRRVALRVLGND